MKHDQSLKLTAQRQQDVLQSALARYSVSPKSKLDSRNRRQPHHTSHNQVSTGLPAAAQTVASLITNKLPQNNASEKRAAPGNFLSKLQQQQLTEGNLFSSPNGWQKRAPKTPSQVRTSNQNLYLHLAQLPNSRTFKHTAQSKTPNRKRNHPNPPPTFAEQSTLPETFTIQTTDTTTEDHHNSSTISSNLKQSRRVIKMSSDGVNVNQKATTSANWEQKSISGSYDFRKTDFIPNRKAPFRNTPLSFCNQSLLNEKASYIVVNPQPSGKSPRRAGAGGYQTSQHQRSLTHNSMNISSKPNPPATAAQRQEIMFVPKVNQSPRWRRNQKSLSLKEQTPPNIRSTGGVQSMLSSRSRQFSTDQKKVADKQRDWPIYDWKPVTFEEAFSSQQAQMFNQMTEREPFMQRRNNRISLVARNNNNKSQAQERDQDSQVSDAFRVNYASVMSGVGKREVGKATFTQATHNDDELTCQELIDQSRKVHETSKQKHQNAIRKQSREKYETNKYSRFQQSCEKMKSSAVENMKGMEVEEGEDMWSESDASDHRHDQKTIEIDNQLMDRLYKAANHKNQNNNAPELFKHRNDGRLSDQDRQNQIAMKLTDWFLSNQKENNKDSDDKEPGIEEPEMEQPLMRSQKKPAFVRQKQVQRRFAAPQVQKLDLVDCIRDETLVKRATKIVKQIKVYEIGQKSHEEYFCHTFRNDPNLLYHKVVHEAKELILPLLNKIVDNKLILKDYTLDSGHLNGLASCLKNKTITIDAVLFDNCGIDDEELAILLEGLLALDGIEHFVYKNNVFQQEGLEAIKPLLLKPDPRNLQELRLVNCATHPYLMTEMIQFMADEKVQIRSLSLVRMQISKICLDQIADFVKDSMFMEDLDLSWNNLLPQDFCHLFNVLSRNITLRSLNLSCNTIINKENQNDKVINNAFQSMLDDYVFRRREAVFAGKQYTLDQKYLKNYPVQVTYGLGQLIRHNKIIQSVNMNNTGLNAQIMMGLMPSIRRARSLLCLHMASNPGISAPVITFYQMRLKTLPTVPFKIQLESEQLDGISPEEQDRLSPRSLEIKQHKVKHYRNWKNQELESYRNTRRLKPLVNKQDATLKIDVRDLSICRILNNEALIPDCGRWKLNTVLGPDTCWVCDNWVFTLYFWNEKIGQNNDINSIGVDQMTKKNLVRSVKMHNEETYMNDGQVPVLFSAIEQWQPRPFFKLLDFINILAPGMMPPFESLAKNAAQQHFKFEDMDNYPEYRKREVDRFLDITTKRMQYEWGSIREANAEKFVAECIKYKKPALINVDQVATNIGNMYVVPIFLPPGKNDFLIRTRQYEITNTMSTSSDFSWYYRRYISEIRQESIPLFSKKKRAVNDQQVALVKHKSMFKDWHHDTQETIERCFRNDQKFWKVERVCGGIEKAKTVLDIFTARFVPLKEIFVVSTIMNNTPPEFSKKEMYKFCQRAGIIDKKLNQNIFDIYWKVTNFEEIDQECNSDDALNRFEFFEILLRLAKGKYIEFGNETQLAYALMKLLQTHILPMVPQLWPLQSWRDEQFWTTEINELLKVNEGQIWQVYNHIAKQPFILNKNRLVDMGKSLVSIDKLRDTLVPVLQPLLLTEQMIVQAFFLSKMTVANENDDANYEYTYIHRPEFLEFIGRLAWLKYKDTYLNDSWPLIKKMHVVMTVLFEMVGVKVQEPPELEMCVSESDDDY